VIEEAATVAAVQDGFAWVDTRRQSTCGSCAARKGCGTATIAKLFERRQRRVRAIDSIGARVGDRVMIGLAEGALLQGSLAVYLVPIASMMLGAGVGELLAVNTGAQDPETVSVVMGIAGMAVGLAWVRMFARRIEADERYQPTVLRVLP